MKYLLLILTFLAFMPTILADDGSGCRTWSPMGADGFVADCYAPQIYQSEQKIIQLEEQNARIGAIAVCQSGDAFGEGGSVYHDSSTGTFSTLQDDLNACVSKVLNDTK